MGQDPSCHDDLLFLPVFSLPAADTDEMQAESLQDAPGRLYRFLQYPEAVSSPASPT